MQAPTDINWAAVSAVVSTITLVGVVGIGGMMWGSLTEKVAGIIKRVDSHKSEIAEIDGRLNSHDIQIGKLEEWKAGYNAAVQMGRHVTEI